MMIYLFRRKLHTWFRKITDYGDYQVIRHLNSDFPWQIEECSMCHRKFHKFSKVYYIVYKGKSGDVLLEGDFCKRCAKQMIEELTKEERGDDF